MPNEMTNEELQEAIRVTLFNLDSLWRGDPAAKLLLPHLAMLLDVQKTRATFYENHPDTEARHA